MTTSIDCPECGNNTFTNMSHHYYSMTWTVDCAECGETITLHEAEDTQ